MTADALFQKALLLLDRGDLVRGEEVLRSALEKARDSGDATTEGRALCCLGDLLVQQGRNEEAQGHLSAMLALPVTDDVLDCERNEAARLLDEIGSA